VTSPRTISARARPRLLAGLLAGLARPSSIRGVSAADAAPDILVMVMNDARDGDQVALPQAMSRLAARGTTFPNFFLTTPLCCPSRASILTGLFPHNHGVYDNSEGANGGWEGFAMRGNRGRTTGVILQAAGYRTAALGMYLNGEQLGTTEEPGWDIGPVTQVNVPSDTALAEAAASIFAETSIDQPLYLHIGFGSPHVPVNPSPPYAGQFSGSAIDRDDASFNEEDVEDKPEYIRDLRRLDQADEAWLDDQYQRRLETLLEVDDSVATIWNALEARGRLDNTYIFLMTDNGFLLGQHRFYGKIAPYDGSARMPLYAFGPGFSAGAVDPRLVANIDVAPTLLEVAGAEGPVMDGRSLLSDHRRDEILLEMVAPKSQSMKWPGPRAKIPSYSAVRTADRLYVEYSTGERELYDYGSDPQETRNLLAGSQLLEEDDPAAQLALRLDAIRTCEGASCP
jgi:N-acetylglucosamine-6-sulfatase